MRPRPGPAARPSNRLALASLLCLAALPCQSQDPSSAAQEPQVAPAVEARNLGAVEARTGALLLSGQAGGEVDGALLWTITGHGGDGRAALPFVVEVDGEALLGEAPARRLTLGIYAYVVGTDGRVVDYLAQGLVLDAETHADRIRRTGLKFVGRFELVPGSYALRVLVRNHAGNAFFMSWSLLEVPAADDPAARLLPPLFPDPDSGWVVARQAGLAAGVEVGALRTIVPAARPTLVENRPAELFVADHGWGATARIGVRLVNDVGRTVAEPAVETTAEEDAGPGFRRLELAPLDLPPGSYTLIMSLDGAGDEVLRRAAKVVVVAEGGQRAWATAAGSETVAAAETAAGEEQQRLRKRELREAYLEALAALAGGDPHGARLAMAGLERRAMVEPSPKALRELTETEQNLVRKLGNAKPASLAPIALLHRDLERSYAARNEGMLASHARVMAVATAEQLGRLQPGNLFPAKLMVNIAVDLAQAMAASAARELLEQALRLEPDHGPALLSLGFSFERAGEHAEAASLYNKLVQIEPEHHEGRLRLAINLIRTGRNQAGEERLRALQQRGAPAWIGALADQELVRLLIATDRPETAEREARAALQRRPEDQRLWVLLASILEDRGRNDEALEALRELPAAARGVSPRARYAEWPDLGVEASQQHLFEEARGADAELAAALAAVGR